MNEAAHLAPSIFAPTRHKLDVAAFYRMAEVGIIGERDRIELIDGELIDMAPIGDDHIDAVDWLAERFVLASHGRAVTSVQNPLRLDRQNQPQPDLALYRRGGPGKQRGPADALLVVEVADSSLGYDGTTKLALYASFGIPEYWIVDLPAKRVLVHRRPGPDGYGDITVHATATRLALAADPEIVLDLDPEFRST